MDGRALPVIRVTLDHMKHEIASFLGIRGSEMSKMIEEAIDTQLLKELDPKRIAGLIDEQIDKAVASYFTYGEGAEIINKLVITELSGALNKKIKKEK